MTMWDFHENAKDCIFFDGQWIDIRENLQETIVVALKS